MQNNANELDKGFLRYHGGLDKNSLINVLDSDSDELDCQPKLIKHSPYYENADFVSMIPDLQNNFTIFSTNIQSIFAKFDSLQIYVESLKTEGFEYSAICLQECQLKENDDTSWLQLEGYNCIPLPQSGCTRKGGLLIYLHKKYESKVDLNISNFSTWEGQFIQIKAGKCLNKSLYLGNIYRAPRTLVADYSAFTQEFSLILSRYETGSSDVLIAGDFNINLLQINNNAHFSNYFDMLTAHSFYPKITLPTRLNGIHGTSTLIDNIVCKLTKSTMDTTSGIFINKISDHQPYFISLKHFCKIDKNPHYYIKVTKQNKEALEDFQNEVRNQSNNFQFNTDINNNPNVNYNMMHEIIQISKNKCMPEKIIKFNKYKHKKNPWITRGLIKSIKQRDEKYKLLKFTNPSSLTYNCQKENLTAFNNILRKIIRMAKKSYYELTFNKYKHDMKSTWKSINEILHKKKTKKNFTAIIVDGTVSITDKATIANKFNDFFINIGSQLAETIINPPNKSYSDYLTHNNNDNFQFHSVKESDIELLIKKMETKKSSGFDGISAVLLKHLPSNIIRLITVTLFWTSLVSVTVETELYERYYDKAGDILPTTAI
ncbi:hypothetical protein GQR58_023766 [Nymphon striatum]|nr:hypothetical protein GQR58_023766 [Nymphon striatum]